MEPPRTFSDMVQTIGRLYRVGQKSFVEVYHVFAKYTHDEKVLAAAARKYASHQVVVSDDIRTALDPILRSRCGGDDNVTVASISQDVVVDILAELLMRHSLQLPKEYLSKHNRSLADYGTFTDGAIMTEAKRKMSSRRLETHKLKHYTTDEHDLRVKVPGTTPEERPYLTAAKVKELGSSVQVDSDIALRVKSSRLHAMITPMKKNRRLDKIRDNCEDKCMWCLLAGRTCFTLSASGMRCTRCPDALRDEHCFKACLSHSDVIFQAVKAAAASSQASDLSNLSTAKQRRFFVAIGLTATEQHRKICADILLQAMNNTNAEWNDCEACTPHLKLRTVEQFLHS